MDKANSGVCKNCNNHIREKCISDVDMPIEEYQKRLVDAEHRAAKAEKENRLLKECIGRMALGRWGVLDE